ncbi:hypothetical protein [Streptomyces sp. SM11]|uniref:hypothetical protein n=1 Tax=Streptomyces sp. SM11 TaxID=565557 RepID=UPI0021565F90|nr:hypothetical protein [Streptomyces sp. SM11]
MSLVMLAVMGAFPVSVAVAGFGVRHLGAAPFFPVAGAAIALSVLGALTQRAFRDHRAGTEYAPPVSVPEEAPQSGPASGVPAARATHPRQENSQESQQ